MRSATVISGCHHRLMAWRRRAVHALLSVAALAVPAACSARAGTPFAVGAPGAGDPYYPLQGNGGYQATAYRIALRYDPDTKSLEGFTTIKARAAENLARFDLDLRTWLRASAVTVDGR